MIGCLCIHGFTGGAYEVEPLAAYLKEKTNWKVAVPTLPGHGMELSLDTVTFEDWVEAAETELSNLLIQCDEIFLIGFSMGGMISAYLAAKYQVAKLVLLSPSRKYINMKQLSLDFSQFVKEGITGELKDNELFQRYVRKQGSVPLKATLEFLKCMKFTKPYLKEISCPVFVAQGIQDGMVPYQSAYYIDKEIPANTEVVFFHDSKHHICLGEDKDVLNQAVYQFLSR
ncbi:alpha/beta hydrolase [Aquibacillus salsiterrae]|uniref:Alpha/beta fold hydrolase n=1 Tax=Aquibacillus salsiterrae TaxID=2950439 RepID=A0A9X4AGF4_9BACI|nr:alpha/beta fold hydrolase [Aquibacillus salsiterrae]MDC3417038.1 alpha/beta fold hydrolase [Aquibacillus salsiterrae]